MKPTTQPPVLTDSEKLMGGETLIKFDPGLQNQTMQTYRDFEASHCIQNADLQYAVKTPQLWQRQSFLCHGLNGSFIIQFLDMMTG
jgi:hypothetical protein